MEFYIRINVIERYTILYKMCFIEFSVSSGHQIMWLAGLNSENIFPALNVALKLVVMCGIPFALGGLYYRPKYKRAKKIHQLMLDTKTTPIGSLKPGPVEIRGRVSSSVPPAPSPWAQKPCVFYNFHVEERQSRTHNGRTSTYWVDRINDRRSDPFQVEDETGSVDIIPGEGEFQINADHSTSSGTFNDAPENLRVLLNNRYGQDTQGLIFNKTLRYHESILENGDEIYIFGEVKQKDGKLVIVAGEMPLIISENGEAGGEADYAARASKYKWYYYGFIALGILILTGAFPAAYREWVKL